VTLEIPKHIAIIMDGNGRWAQRRGYPRIFGHVRGSSRVKAVVNQANLLGVKALTLYAFSTENWMRPESEIRVLWKLLKKYLLRDIDELDRKNVRLQVIGEVERLDADVRLALETSIRRLSGNTGLCLTFALSYGSRRELVRAAQLFARECIEGKRSPESMTEDMMNQFLWTSEMGEIAEVDLFIRTSGEQRVSNFLLWQSAYAEFYFCDACWPDFSEQDLTHAVEEFSRRDRRFGAVESNRRVKIKYDSENRSRTE
jgi:undecaprenyl diphosphate synthase